MGGSRNRRRQKKVEMPPQSFQDELLAVKDNIAGMQIKLENSILSNERLRCVNTLLVHDLKMEQEAKTPFMLSLQLFEHRRTSELHRELAELAINNKVSQSDHSCVSNMFHHVENRLEDHLNVEKEFTKQFTQAHMLFEQRRTAELHREIIELAIKNRVSKADHNCISNMLVSRVPNHEEPILDLEQRIYASIRESSSIINDNKELDSKLGANEEIRRLLEDQLRNMRKREEAVVNKNVSKMLVVEKKCQMDEFIESEKSHMEELHSVKQDIAKEKDPIVSELKEQISCIKTSYDDAVQSLVLDKESARIANNAIMSAMEETYEEDREQRERMVQKLSNELFRVKTSNTEIISKIQDLQLDQNCARISSNAIMSAIQQTYEKDHEQQERMVQELKNIIDELKKENAIMQQQKELSDEQLKDITEEFENEKREKSKAEEFVELLSTKVSQQDEEINELTARLRRKRGLRGLISCF